jgi:hypothetical protein
MKNAVPLKIYIAGQITGLPLTEAKENFRSIEDQLHDMGYEPINPMRHLGIPEHWTSEQALPYCLEAVEKCEGIYIQSNWRKSEGTQREIERAQRLGRELFFAESGGMKMLEDLSRHLFERTTQ